MPDLELIFKKLELRPDMVAADLGCGSGKLAIPLSKKLTDGFVYAIDVQESPLKVLKKEIIQQRINNIGIIKYDLEDNKRLLKPCFFDLALAVNILLQVKDKNAIMIEAHRILKNKGIFFALDSLDKVAPAEMKKAGELAGLRLLNKFFIGDNHYGMVFTKI